MFQALFDFGVCWQLGFDFWGPWVFITVQSSSSILQLEILRPGMEWIFQDAFWVLGHSRISTENVFKILWFNFFWRLERKIGASSSMALAEMGPCQNMGLHSKWKMAVSRFQGSSKMKAPWRACNISLPICPAKWNILDWVSQDLQACQGKTSWWTFLIWAAVCLSHWDGYFWMFLDACQWFGRLWNVLTISSILQNCSAFLELEWRLPFDESPWAL